MSDPEVSRPEQRSDVDDVVDNANAGLAEAEAVRGDVPAPVDPDLEAFEAAEREHPGTFSTAAPIDAASDRDLSTADSALNTSDADESGAETSIADTAYLAPAADDVETRVVPSEPVVTESATAEPIAETVVAETVIAASPQHQPIFVQAPEPPRERGNRGTAGLIGLLATLCFAILYLAVSIGWDAVAGEVTGENFVDAVLATLTTWGLWVPVVVFFIGFWLLGAIVNRGRWWLWVIFGLLVGVIAYGGHLLGQLFEAPFWLITASQASDLMGEQFFAPLAITAFVIGRELTIWFGAWVARVGARKTALNEADQLEYERTLEAGPTLSR